MRPKKAIIIMIILTPFLIIANTVLQAAGNGTIEGVVTNQKGKPVVGASVMIVGTTRGAQTDFDGRYKINKIEPGVYTLRITHLEFNTIEISNVVVKAENTSEVSTKPGAKTTDLDKIIKNTGKQGQVKVYEKGK